MNDRKKIEIPLSKSKLTKLLIFSILFLLGGFWIIASQPYSPIINDPIIKNIAAIGCVLMGLFGIYFFSKKLLDKKAGIVIDNIGIIDNSGALSLGRIPWTDISEIKEKIVQESKQKFITLILKNPESYISKQTNAIKRKAITLKSKNSDSPVNISTNALNIKHDDLLKLMSEKFIEYKLQNNLDN